MLYEQARDFIISVRASLGLKVPEDMSEEARIKSRRCLKDFIEAPRIIRPERVFLLDQIEKRPWDVDVQGREVFVSPALSKPGFSNKKGSQQLAKATLTEHEFVVATVIENQAQDQYYQGRVCAGAVLAMVEYCEDQLINGDGSKHTGLLNLSDATSVTKYLEESLEDFYRRALQEYASITGGKPTHIVFSHADQLKLHAAKGIESAAKKLPQKLDEVPLIALDFVPEGHGLILAVDDIVLAASPVEWQLGCGKGNLSAKDHSEIIASWEMGLVIKNPAAIVQLTLEGKSFLDS